jgi:hypothetical protein
MRHQLLCLLMLTFVAGHTERLRGGNPEVTMEQVCRALNLLSLEWQENRRGDDSPSAQAGYHHLPPAKEPSRTRSPPAKEAT